MFPFLVLVTVTLIFRALGAVGIDPFNNWITSLRPALCVMFLFTASAHWGKRRPDLIAMVPPFFPRPDVMVTITGLLELLGAIGLLFPPIAPAAATGLALMLIAIFPANIRAAREHLTIGGRPATPLALRALLQIAFIAALIAAGFPAALGISAR
jgi:uncharacterized membrane protein